MSKILILLLFLTSCAIPRYYKCDAEAYVEKLPNGEVRIIKCTLWKYDIGENQ